MIGNKKKPEDIYEKFPQLKNIPADKFPGFLFIIPDGNRRYAKEKGQPALWGHKKGFDVMIKLLRMLRYTPVKIVGFWGFSSDNWQRNEKEIEGLMGIFELMMSKHLGELMENNAKLVHIGRKDRLPKRLVDKIKDAEEKTKNNTGQILVIALDFGGDDQMIRMVEKAKKLDKNTVVTPEVLYSLRDGGGLIPPTDLIIRTSEIRTSDVGWLNGKPTVLYFIPGKYFPQMDESDVFKGIEFFVNTKRRQGS